MIPLFSDGPLRLEEWREFCFVRNHARDRLLDFLRRAVALAPPSSAIRVHGIPHYPAPKREGNRPPMTMIARSAPSPSIRIGESRDPSPPTPPSIRVRTMAVRRISLRRGGMPQAVHQTGRLPSCLVCGTNGERRLAEQSRPGGPGARSARRFAAARAAAGCRCSRGP